MMKTVGQKLLYIIGTAIMLTTSAAAYWIMSRTKEEKPAPTPAPSAIIQPTPLQSPTIAPEELLISPTPSPIVTRQPKSLPRIKEDEQEDEEDD